MLQLDPCRQYPARDSANLDLELSVPNSARIGLRRTSDLEFDVPDSVRILAVQMPLDDVNKPIVCAHVSQAATAHKSPHRMQHSRLWCFDSLQEAVFAQSPSYVEISLSNTPFAGGKV